METIIAIGVVLLIFAFLSFLVFYINTSKNEIKDSSFAENTCQRISGAISEAYILGPGAEFSINSGYDSAFDSGNSIFMKWKDKEVFCRSSVMFTNSTSSTFSLGKGIILIQNINNAVVVTGG